MDGVLDKFLNSRLNIFLVFLLVGLAFYAVILPTQFKTMDDLISIVNNPRIHSVNNIDQIFTTSFFNEQSYYRPLVLFSYMLEYQLVGLKSFYYNLNNVLLHIINAFLCYLIVFNIGRDKRISFMIGLIYLIHPVHSEAVSNIPGRSITLCSVFFLSAVVLFQRYYSKAKSAGALMGSVTCYALSLLCKESAIVMPGCLMAYVFFIHKSKRIIDYIKFWPYALTAVVYLMVRHSLGIHSVNAWEGPKELILGVATFYRSALHYVYQTILPTNLYYDHTTPLFQRFDLMSVGVMLLWLIVFGGCFIFRKRLSDQIKFFLVWIFINFITVMQLIPIHAPGGRISSADHFLYLPILGMIAILVLGVAQLLQTKLQLKPSIKMFVVGGYVVFLGLTLLQQNIYSTNQVAMFERSLEHHPGNIRVRNSLAVCYAYAGKFQEAEFHYKEALKVDPYNTDALVGAGQAMADQGRYAEALRSYQQVRNPEVFESTYRRNLEYVLEKLGHKKVENWLQI